MYVHTYDISRVSIFLCVSLYTISNYERSTLPACLQPAGGCDNADADELQISNGRACQLHALHAHTHTWRQRNKYVVYIVCECVCVWSGVS